MTNPLIHAEALSVELNGDLALERITLAVEAGEIVTLIGPNGAGKTTLLRALLGLQAPSAGKVTRRSGLRIGYMPQRLEVSRTLPMTVARFLGLARRGLLAQSEALAITETDHLAERPLAAVSGGEFQRILLARALLAEPELLVLDEPAQGVDVQGQADLYRLIGTLREQRGCGILMVSHDLHLVMASTDTVVCLNRHVCCHGHPEAVRIDPAYINLFGQVREPALAVYAHHHDHEHTMHGDVAQIDGQHHDV